MQTRHSNQHILIYIGALFLYALLWGWCNITFKNGDLGIWNIICMSSSLIIETGTIICLRKKGAKCYLVFLCIYFGVLLINTLNISGYQTEKDVKDIYFYFVGGLVFAFWLYLGEKVNLKITNIISIKQINKKNLYGLVFIGYVLLSIVNFIRNGIPLLGGLYSSAALNMYKEGGISGICMILSYILLILASENKGKKRFITYAVVILIEGILKFSRGNLFRILLFLLIMFVNRLGYNYKKYIKYIVVFILLLAVSFGFLGNIRTNMRGEITGGNTTAWMNNYIDTNINLGIFGWVYGYTAINFDTMKMVYYQEKTNPLSTFITPMARIFGGTEAVEQYNVDHAFDTGVYSNFSVNSMKVFIAPYIRDMGYLFFLELSLVGFLYMLFISYARNRNHIGLYNYIIMLCGLSVCGNYLFTSTYLYTILGSIIIFSIVKPLEDLEYD